jgi:hypothetical protein
MDSQIVKMKRKLRAKIRRGRGTVGATTISGMLQGMKQRAKSGLVKTKSLGVKMGSGSQINNVRNKVTGIQNRTRL